jgi:hypothetical protein
MRRGLGAGGGLPRHAGNTRVEEVMRVLPAALAQLASLGLRALAEQPDGPCGGGPARCRGETNHDWSVVSIFTSLPLGPIVAQ